MIEQMVRILVEAGATPASAVRAAVELEQGATVTEVYDLIELAAVPIDVDGALLAAAIATARERVLVEVRS